VVPTNVLEAWILWAIAAFIAYLFLFSLVWGAGYSPTSRRQLAAAAALLQLEDGDTVYDLGSGFGGALIFFAKEHRLKAVGAEVDPLRRAVCMWKVRRQGLSSRVTVLRKNLLDVDLRDSRKVFFFLSPLLMRKLQEKVAREMPPGALVVSVEHRFPDWKPVESIDDVRLYVVGANPKVTDVAEKT
jgi:SAM-dependent methyltransferase